MFEYHDDGPREVARHEGMRDQVGAAFQRGPISGGGVAAATPTAAASSSHVDVGAVGRHLPPDRWHEAGAPLMAAPAAVTARGGRRLCCRLRDPPSRGGGLARRPPTSMPRWRRRRRTPSPPSFRRSWAGGMLPSRPGPTSSSAAVAMISHFPVTGVFCVTTCVLCHYLYVV